MPVQKLFTEGIEIREPKEDHFILLSKSRRVAKCDSIEWAEQFTNLYNQANGFSYERPDDPIAERISEHYFDELIQGGMSEKKAAVLTLRYLGGFFEKHIQNENISKVLNAVEKNFKYPKGTDK